MAHKKPANTQQMQFVAANMDKMTLKEMAGIMGKTIGDVHRIKKTIREGGFQDVDFPKPSPPPKTFIRPPAIYNNRSHDEVLDYWMNLTI